MSKRLEGKEMKKFTLSLIVSISIMTISMGQVPGVASKAGSKQPGKSATKAKVAKKPVAKVVTKPSSKASAKSPAKAPATAAPSVPVSAHSGLDDIALAVSQAKPDAATKTEVSKTQKTDVPKSATNTPATASAPASSTQVVPPAEKVSSSTPSTPVESTPAPTPVATPTTRAPKIKLVSNVFTDTDIKAVIQEVSTASGATIIADTSVKGIEINIEFKKDTVESALEKLSYAAGLLWKKKGDVYIVSTASPEAPLFSEFAETKVYTPHTQPAENLFALLTRTYTAYAMLDKAANMISVTAPPKQMEMIWKALTAADSPRKQFAVEAMVTEMNTQDIKTAGFSWNWQYFAQGSDLSLTYATATASDLVSIKSMITNNKADLKANPKIMATEGHEASLSVGNETYFSMVSGSTTSQSVQYQRITTGVTLKFTGYIEADGMVNLHIQPEVSDAVTLVNGNPQTTMRKADTFIRVKFGDTIALGGMVLATTTNNTTKVPVLGDLPIVGQAFRNTTKEKDKKEVVILITPRMIQQALGSES